MNLGQRQRLRRGDGYFVRKLMEEDLQHLIQAIIAYEENPCCPHAREHLRKIRLHCVCNYTPEQVQEATHEAYKQIRF